MPRVIPNQNTWLGFSTSIASATLVPTTTEIGASINLTKFLMGMNASSTGNVIPTPAFDSLFETSIIGTSQSSFTADFYRDSTADTAWTTLPRGTKGFFILSRFGGTGTNQAPAVGNVTEVWPVTVSSRTGANLANNAVQTMAIVCAVPQEPNEAATITV